MKIVHNVAKAKMFVYICEKVHTMNIGKFKKITSAIQKETDIPAILLKSKIRTQEVVFARMMFSFILNKTRNIEVTDIATVLKLDSETIRYYLQKFEDDLKQNTQLMETYQKVLKRIHATNKITAPEDEIFIKLCNEYFGVDLVREFQFHNTRRWRLDFAILEMKIAIEKEGGLWVGGRHNRAVGFINDCEKYNTAASMGWIVLRATPQNITSPEFFEILKNSIILRQKNSVTI